MLYWPLRRVQQRKPARLPATTERMHAGRAARLTEVVASWRAPDSAACLQRSDGVLAGRFRFLNHEEVLRPGDWTRRRVSHLWSYNLHYFDYALDLAWAYRLTGKTRFADGFASLAIQWIEQMEAVGGDGWEPYVLSMRAVNWMSAVLLLEDALSSDARELIVASIFRQLAVLEARLEKHLLANHYQKNLHALAMGGLFFDGDCADRWRRRFGVALWQQAEEQLLDDGGHIERSPMYHAIALTDFLQAIALYRSVGEEIPPGALARVRKAVYAYGVLSRPHGSLHLFNDAAHGIAPSREYIARLSHAVLDAGVPAPGGLVVLPEMGFAGYVNEAEGERFMQDRGEPAPSYQPAHAHCGLLGFELDLMNRPVVVDAGVHGYDGDPLREYVRSTRAHNTVMIGGREQSEVWGTFRMAGRARVVFTDTERAESSLCFMGAYRPYHSRRTVHHREIVRRASEGWTISDRVEGSPGVLLESFLHLHPTFDTALDSGHIIARAGDLGIRIEPFGVDDVRIVSGVAGRAQGWYCPEFGCAIAAPAIIMRVEHNTGARFGYRITRLS